MGSNQSTPSDSDTGLTGLYDPNYAAPASSKDPGADQWLYYYNYCLDNYQILENNPAYSGLPDATRWKFCASWASKKEDEDPSALHDLVPPKIPTTSCLQEMLDYIK